MANANLPISPRVDKHAITYRPDIDGLRAIAVMVVVIFHAKIGVFPGGFVGVDIFFVISGFLISSIILRDIGAGNFKIVDFMERRVRRIMPALVVVVAATLVAAWYLYLPEDYDLLGRAMMAQSLFVSNIFHWSVSNYFGPLAEDLPLLHTWSLAVEEQFYIFFPLILLGVGIWRRRWLPMVTLLLGVGSLCLSLWAIRWHQKDAFYFLPHRAWEMLLGAVLAAYPVLGRNAPRWIRELACWGGLGAIAAAVVYFDSFTRFPGKAALVPCFGAAAFIWANRDGRTWGGRILSLKPLVFVGKISYSLYLIHWPVLVFSMYWYREELTVGWRVALVVITFLLSILSWHFIETTVRKKRVFAERRTLFSLAAVAMFLLLAGGYWVHRERGFPTRFNAQALKYAEARKSFSFRSAMSLKEARNGAFVKLGAQNGPVKCLLWGDCHAMAMASVLDTLLREKGYRGFAAMHSSTAPFLNFTSRGKYALKEDSVEFAETVVAFAIAQNIQTVVLVSRWSIHSGESAFAPCLRQTLARLSSAGLKVVIVREVPMQTGDTPWLLAKAAKLGRAVSSVGLPLEQYRKRNKNADEIFSKIAPSEATVLDPITYFADEKGLCRAEYDGESMYFDVHHLSIPGALRLKPMFDSIF